uniref:Uncharacterized protein n=1 Tax=Helminthocladia australis TaxID=260093 RepID=A0A1G4NTS9_9FLOR|nr:Hypothetical protein ORF_7 [Helminthocladia australis]SCW21909.1 Hypothetical protein ORF_7 [Helminthocladia australis]
MDINPDTDFIKIWQYNFFKQYKQSIRRGLAIPKQMRILLTSNGSFTRNSTIIYNKRTNILLIKQKHDLHKVQYNNIEKECKAKYYREVWLTQDPDKKKLFLLSHKDVQQKTYQL